MHQVCIRKPVGTNSIVHNYQLVFAVDSKRLKEVIALVVLFMGIHTAVCMTFAMIDKFHVVFNCEYH